MKIDWNSTRDWRLRCQGSWGVQQTLDLWDFVHNRRELRGAFPVTLFERALEDLPDQPVVRNADSARDDELGVVWFEIKGDSQIGERASLTLQLQANVVLVCQRCLEPMTLQVSGQERFDVVTEAQLAQMDHEEIDPEEVELLVGSRQFDLIELLEDQLVLEIPYIPKHDICAVEGFHDEPEPEQAQETAQKPNPFDVLEQLKRKN